MRFATASDVLVAYPSMGLAFRSAIDGSSSQTFVERLVAEGRWPDAIAFLAHLMPRREMVWWAGRCVRMEPQSFTVNEEPLIVAAESWARDPSEQKRKQALALAEGGDAGRAAVWVARAAGWSGGSMMEIDGTRIMSEPQMCPAAVRGAVLLASTAANDPQAFLGRCVNEATTLLSRISDK